MMYLYAEEFGRTTSALYFISFHMIVQLFLLALLKGMLWDVFNVVDQSVNSMEEEERLMHNSGAAEDDHGNCNFLFF